MIHKAGALTLAASALALFALFGQASNAIHTELDLPQPNGCYAVGTRQEVLRDTQRNRSLVVTTWYPAAGAKLQVAPYMDKKTADALAEEFKLRPDFQLLVHAHARLSPPMGAGGLFPVVLLEHGSSVVPAIYTVLSEGLASAGLIVVATNHPHDSLISVFPDGHEVRFAPYWPADADRRTQGIAIGKFANDVLVPDVRFVLDQLEQLNAHDHFWQGHLNMSKVGIVGHSLGGTTAALATQKDSRIVAAVNLDGSTYPGMNADVRPVPVNKPFLFLASEAHASGATRAREYVGSDSNTYYVVLSGADHMSFSDADLLSSRFTRDSQPDDSALEHALLRIELTRSLVEQFLGKYLNGVPAPDLDSPAQIERR